MNEQTLTINNTAIHVRTAGTSGSTIVLIHGNSASSLAYQKQLESELSQHYRLIALDLPGHGASGAASDPSIYSLPGYAGIVAGVAEQLNAKDAVFVGWSLGGHLLLEAAALLPAAKGMLIFGTPPVGKPPAMDKAFLPHPTNGVLFNPELTDDQAKDFATSFFQAGTVAPDAFIADVKRTRGEARLNMGMSIGGGHYTDELDIVANLKCPLAVLHGANEQLVNGAYIETVNMPTLWRGAVQYVENSGHAPQWENPPAFNGLLAAFANDCTGT
jgi:pimeloyl-ACP methyl ester carboxylesterase